MLIEVLKDMQNAQAAEAVKKLASPIVIEGRHCYLGVGQNWCLLNMAIKKDVEVCRSV